MFRAVRIVARNFTTDQQFKEKLKQQLKDSMKFKNKLQVNVIKSVLADIVNQEKSGLQKHVSVGELIQRGIKKRRDSIEQFRGASRLDLAEQEEIEIEILSSFLPKQMTKEEIEEIVAKVVKEQGIKSVGELMKIMVHKLDAAIAPRSILSQVVKDSIKKT
jgi:uncharacterized protein YqeY